MGLRGSRGQASGGLVARSLQRSFSGQVSAPAHPCNSVGSLTPRLDYGSSMEPTPSGQADTAQAKQRRCR